jgi:hypothetical protein
MSIEARREYLQAIRERYQKANRKEKTQILNEYCEVCQYDRKYAIKILNRPSTERQRRPGPEPKYDAEVIKHLVEVWRLMDQMCSKNMKVALPHWLPYYKGIDDRVRELLLKISASTIDRALKPYRNAFRRGLSSTKPSLIKNRIPIELLDNEITEPGFMEGDTVVHCGDTLLGNYINSLTMTDIFSGWTENRSMPNKTGEEVKRAMKNIEKDLPFVLLGFASDNGSEFLNEDVYAYFSRRKTPIKVVRRRPYKKNDNAHVEQKNWTHVREIFGYERLESTEILELMNDIYQNYWNPLKNYFTPSMKLKEKIRVGGKIKKTYEESKTPYQRLMEHPNVSPWAKGRMQNQYQSINPFELKKELERKLNFFFRLVEIEKRKRSQTGS